MGWTKRVATCGFTRYTCLRICTYLATIRHVPNISGYVTDVFVGCVCVGLLALMPTKYSVLLQVEDQTFNHLYGMHLTIWQKPRLRKVHIWPLRSGVLTGQLHNCFSCMRWIHLFWVRLVFEKTIIHNNCTTHARTQLVFPAANSPLIYYTFDEGLTFQIQSFTPSTIRPRSLKFNPVHLLWAIGHDNTTNKVRWAPF